MARLTPALQKVFAGAVTPANNIAQFASTITGTPIYTSNPDTIQALSAWENSGLFGSLIQTGGGQNSPVFQELNALFFLMSRQIAYLYQSGVPEWLATQTYYIGQFSSDGLGVIYVSQTNANLNNALSDTNNWLPLGTTIKGPGIAKAWVTFTSSGGTGSKTILDGFNVSSVTKSSTGIYLVNFPGGVFANANYSFNGTGGSANGGTGFGVCTITNGFSGTAIKTTTQIKLFSIYQEAGGQLADPPQIMLQFFSS